MNKRLHNPISLTVEQLQHLLGTRRVATMTLTERARGAAVGGTRLGRSASGQQQRGHTRRITFESFLDARSRQSQVDAACVQSCSTLRIDGVGARAGVEKECAEVQAPLIRREHERRPPRLVPCVYGSACE
jgi:hypothetical protein